MINKKFSLLELMAVTLIILLLLSLLIPVFLQMKSKAKTALCKDQLRQIGIIITTYTSDNNGYLPDDQKTDIKQSALSNDEFYRDWNGHLLPYIDSGLKSYNRSSALRKSGEVYVNLGNGKSSVNPTDQFSGGWIVIKDAYEKGGFNELKLFICPEIHNHTYDIGVSNTFNGLKVPKIDNLADDFPANGWDFLGGGIPTTYLANNIFFGQNTPSSLRIDQINTISKKVYIAEGGLAWPKDTNGAPKYVYYNLTGGDLGGDFRYRSISKNTGYHKVNYVHDTISGFWVMDKMLIHDSKDIKNKFNMLFKNQAEMVENEDSYDWCYYNIISYIDPYDKPFDNFFSANGIGVPNPFVSYDEPEFHYLIGNMNLLFGDGSVDTKSQEWIYNNKIFFAQLTKE